MKKLCHILLATVLLLGVIAYGVWCFGEPQREKVVYCRKSEVLEVFRQNYADFEALAYGMPPDADWWYDSSAGTMNVLRPFTGYHHDVLENLLEGDALYAAGRLLYDHGFNRFRRSGDIVVLEHAESIPLADLELGVVYDLTSGQWQYHYSHHYNLCRHKHPMFYRLYDLLFNRETPISIP